jgi:hypothetical protein
MPIRRLASRASTWPRDHFCRSTTAPHRNGCEPLADFFHNVYPIGCSATALVNSSVNLVQAVLTVIAAAHVLLGDVRKIWNTSFPQYAF